MNTLDKQYTDLLQDILDNGVEKDTRNGKVLSVFGRTIRYKFKDGKFPLITTKKMYFKGIVTELLWFLRGDTSIEYLLKNDCHIWDGDCFANYLKTRDRFSNKDNVKEDVVINGMTGSSNRAYTQEEFINKIKTDDEFAKKWADLGRIYGAQWRKWSTNSISRRSSGTLNECDIVEDMQFIENSLIYIDQISELVKQLKDNPNSRRMVVSAWAVHDLPNMVLPPCHYGFQVYTRELSDQERWILYCETCNKLQTQSIKGSTNKEQMEEYYRGYNIPTRAISLMWNQRSVDTFLGLPFNIASYGLLLMMIADEVGMVPDQLIGNLGDVHLYSNHIEQAKQQIQREPMKLPTVHVRDGIYCSSQYDVVLLDYESHPTIKAPLSN